jgi:hypothetical protein
VYATKLQWYISVTWIQGFCEFVTKIAFLEVKTSFAKHQQDFRDVKATFDLIGCSASLICNPIRSNNL